MLSRHHHYKTLNVASESRISSHFCMEAVRVLLIMYVSVTRGEGWSFLVCINARIRREQ